MALKDVSSKSKFLQNFWDLAITESERRIAATTSIVTYLKENTENQEDVQYTLKRLIRGTSSSREAARQGFSMALTELLREFQHIKLVDAMELINSTMELNGQIKGMEEREIIFGKIFCYMAIHRSGRLKNHKENDIAIEIIKGLLELSERKKWVREVCYECAITVTYDLDIDTVQNDVVNLILKFTEGGISKVNHDQLSFVFALQKRLPSCQVPREFQLETIVSKKKYLLKIIELLKESTCTYPRLHTIWYYLFGHILKTDDFQSSLGEVNLEALKEIWQIVVEECLVVGTHERKSIAFKLFELVAPFVPKGKLAEVLLTPAFSKCLLNNYRATRNYLHEGATCLFSKMRQDFPLDFYLFWKKQFDEVPSFEMETDDVEGENLQDPLLKALVSAEDEQEFEKNKQKKIDASRIWALDALCSLLKGKHLKNEDQLVEKVLELVMLKAFFKDTVPTSEHFRQFCVRKVFTIIGSISNDGDIQSSFLLWEKLEKQGHTLIHPLTKAQESCRQRVVDTLKKLSRQLSKKEDKAKKLQIEAFGHLFANVGLQLLDVERSEETESGLEDLHRCYNELCESQKVTSKQSELDPMAVLMDMFISILSNSSTHLRDVVKTVFKSICLKMTETALLSLLDVVCADSSRSEDLFDVGSEGEGDGDGEEDDFAPIEEKTDEEDDEDEDNDDEDEDNDDEDNDDENDEEENEKLNDEENMKREDAALSVMLRHIREKKEKKQELKNLKQKTVHLRLRVAELLEIFVQTSSENPLILKCIEPMLLFLHSDGVTTDSTMNVLYERVKGIYKNKLCHSKDIPKNPSSKIVKEIFQYLIDLVSKGTKEIVQLGSAGILFLIRIQLNGGQDVDRQMLGDLYSSAANNFFQKKNSKISESLFTDLIERYPALAWRFVAPSLVRMASIHDGASSEFLRSAAFRLLTTLLKKKAVRQEKVVQNMITKLGNDMHQVFEEAISVDTLKTKHIRSLLSFGQALLSLNILSEREVSEKYSSLFMNLVEKSKSSAVKNVVSSLLKEKKTPKKGSKKRPRDINATDAEE